MDQGLLSLSARYSFLPTSVTSAQDQDPNFIADVLSITPETTGLVGCLLNFMLHSFVRNVWCSQYRNFLPLLSPNIHFHRSQGPLSIVHALQFTTLQTFRCHTHPNSIQQFLHTQSDNYIMRLRLQNKTRTKRLEYYLYFIQSTSLLHRYSEWHDLAKTGRTSARLLVVWPEDSMSQLLVCLEHLQTVVQCRFHWALIGVGLCQHRG